MSSVNADAGWPSWAKVGAKVVCIDGTPDAPRSHLSDYKSSLPVKGQTYTLGAAVDPAYWYRGPRVAVAELPHIQYEYDYGWHLSRFRPLVTKTQAEDVRAFKSMLRDMPATERLDRLAELMNEPD